MRVYSAILCAPLVLFLSSSIAFSKDFRFGVIGDAGRWNENTKLTRDSMKRADVTQLILPGDNLYSSSYSEAWDPWRSSGFEFAVVAIGNHNDGYVNEIKFFDMPGEYYSKTYGDNIRFIVLNSDNVKNSATQAKFLEQELSAADEEFIFIVYHHPTYTLSHFHGWQEKKDFQLAIRPILANHRNKITAILLGHDHLALLAHFGTQPVILSGANQEVRSDSPINGTQDGVMVKTNWYFDNKPYWVKIEILSGESSAKIEFVRATDSAVKCTTIIKTGVSAELMENCFN